MVRCSPFRKLVFRDSSASAFQSQGMSPSREMVTCGSTATSCRTELVGAVPGIKQVLDAEASRRSYKQVLTPGHHRAVLCWRVSQMAPATGDSRAKVLV